MGRVNVEKHPVEFLRNHPLVNKNKDTLLLAFNFDDLETANTLGSRRGKYKLGKLQFMVP